jgi:FdrA protein
MVVLGKIKKGSYYDSVTLMQCGKRMLAMTGVADAAMVMGTEANRAILNASGLLIPAFHQAGDADLLICVKAETEEAAQAALAAVDDILKRNVAESAGGALRPASIEGALKVLPGANLALISVAGRYAGDQAMTAVENGLHVMLFSDNVPLEKEIELKRVASAKGLLLMGPDCGTAIVNGVPLGFANVVRRGDIGIVAASGTGLQEASSIIRNEGAGISQALGTGGRDVSNEVGGTMFLAALEALAEDEQTKVILLVSKPPHPEVMARIAARTKEMQKPVIAMFVGAGASAGAPATLEQAALMAVAASRAEEPGGVMRRLAAREEEIRRLARAQAKKRKRGQKYVRGLFSGGTFCAEAQALLACSLSQLHSNAPTGATAKLASALKSQANTLIDLGEDEFTQGRLHPMIDYSLCKRRILHEAADPETAVILLDVILGHGANPDPASELCEVISEASKTVMVACSITGTDQDPQNRAEVKKRLEAAGAIVMPSNAAACQLAAYTLARMEDAHAQTVQQ